MAQQPPEWWLKQRSPRFGCADVTIVAIAAIAAFVILILILSRADFAQVLERVPFGNAATATATVTSPSRAGSLPDETATALDIAAATPSPPPSANATLAPQATVAAPAQAVSPPPPTPFPKAVVKSVCVIRLGDKPSTSAPKINVSVGWKVDLDGREADSDNYHWKGIIINDSAAGQYNGTKGWVEASCLNNA